MKNAISLIEKYASGKKIAVAVSGGRDSMCLLHLVLHSEKIDAADVTVVNVEHGLRGEDSVRDSKFVAEYCKRNNVAVTVEKADVPARMKLSGRGAEDEARRARREIFGRLLDEKKAELVLVAHHRGDNAETVLMHIMRGCSVSGLKGMDVLSGGIFRPLLGVSRAEIDDYVAKNAVPYVDDKTNTDTGYFRNFVRAELIPLMEKRCNAETALVSLSCRAREDDGFINSYINENNIVPAFGGGVQIGAEKLKAHPSIANRYAVKMLGKFTDDYTEAAINSIVKAARDDCRAEVAGGLVAASEYGKVTLYRAETIEKKETAFGVGAHFFGVFCVTVRSASETDKFDASDGFGRTLYLNADKIPPGAVIRMRRDGDMFEPFGGGNRKLKEYLIDKKVPLRLRDRLPVIAVGSTVLAVVGVEISRAAKAEKKGSIFAVEVVQRA